MRSLALIKVMAAVFWLCSAAAAQEVVIRGYVERVDPQALTITLRTTGQPRVVQVAPSAVVTIDGRTVRLDAIPLNSEVQIRALSGPNDVARAMDITVTAASTLPSAAAPPGARVEGTLLSVNRPTSQIQIRTQAGDVLVPLGTAPIVGSTGQQLSTAHLRVGDRVMVERGIPTPGGTNYVTQRVVVMGSPVSVAIAPTAAVPANDAAAARAADSRDGSVQVMAFTGTIMGIHPPTNYIRVRTPDGDTRLMVGTAPIYLNGRSAGLSSLRVGDHVVVQQALPEMAGQVPAVHRVTVTDRTAGYRDTSRSER